MTGTRVTIKSSVYFIYPVYFIGFSSIYLSLPSNLRQILMLFNTDSYAKTDFKGQDKPFSLQNWIQTCISIQ